LNSITADLSAYKCSATRGRRRPMEDDGLRGDFQRDRDRIVHSKAFRRLMHKTQVFLDPEGDHYRTRLTHTLEVTQIGRTAARALGLDEDLAEACCLGHDLGHTPFGHAGERMLDSLCSFQFRHHEQSLRVVDLLEGGGRGLNLTHEVRDGILSHNGEDAATLEGRIVYYADRIAYINHDIDDAVRAGILSEVDIPRELTAVLGNSHGERVERMVKGLVSASLAAARVTMDGEVWDACGALRDFMFERVYTHSGAKAEEAKAMDMLAALFAKLMGSPEHLPAEYAPIADREGHERAVCDFVAGMTDRYAVKLYESLFVPRKWHVL